MGGFFGVVSHRDAMSDTFFGTDYHSHLGTRRGGMAAHLAGAMAARSTLPVVGIPVKSTNLDGVDALLSTVQMPSGMPVATVAINGAVNAALLCIQMLAITDTELAAKLDEARKKGAEKVLAANKAVEEKFNA